MRERRFDLGRRGLEEINERQKSSKSDIYTLGEANFEDEDENSTRKQNYIDYRLHTAKRNSRYQPMRPSPF